MPTARKHQIHLNVTPYYHCVSRCVRRAFLCGYDGESQQDFNHRKQWLVEQMQLLTQIFAIRTCAYAVMSNHYHLVLYVDQELALGWSNEEVVQRWATLFPMSKAGSWQKLGVDLERLSDSRKKQLQVWREQLFDISWFMRKLNEFIARRANKEDDCTGRFWEGRFKSQALLDESALLACMAYVDLNPIRSGISQTPETSDFTSIQERIECYQDKQQSTALCPFQDEIEGKDKGVAVMPTTREDYFELVEITGRLLKHGKTGAIPDSLAPILSRLKVNSETWLETVSVLGQSFATFMGRPETMEDCMFRLHRPLMRGLRSAETVFRRTG